MIKPKEYEIVLWEDPATEWDSWTDIEMLSAKKPDLVFSVGWPVREDEYHLFLCMDWSMEKANTIGKIPINAIKSRKKIKLRGFPPKEKSTDDTGSGKPVQD